MDIEKKLKQFFEQLKEPITAAGIDAAARATGYALELIPFYIAFAEFRNINVQRELAALVTAGEKAKAEKDEQKQRTDIKATSEEIQKQLASIITTVEIAPLDEIKEAIANINAETAGLITIAETVNRFPTWADYEVAWQKENEHDFSPKLFGRLSFPEGTVSYIGARTGRGKTTVKVSIGIEALFPQEEKTNPRRVLFISLEENQKQILRRFSLCLAYRDSTEETREKLLTVTNPHTGKTDPKNAYKNWKKGREIGGPGNAEFVRAIIEADKKIKTAVEDGSLVFFDGIGAQLSEIRAAIHARNRGDIVLLDYIQKIPADKVSYSGNSDLERIRDGSDELIKAAKIRECVVIAGAQFNREGYKGKPNGDDEFTDADFRGCGDIEQDGHNLLGIGRSNDKKQFYYKIIKSREGEITDKHYSLIFAGGYSFMANGDQIYTPQSGSVFVARDKKNIGTSGAASTETTGKKNRTTSPKKFLTRNDIKGT